MPSPGEFELIQQYFADITSPEASIRLGVGDDAAIIAPREGQDWIVCVDTLHADKHFWADDPADAIAHKALSVNLSDCAAMGATPVAFLLSLSLPEADSAWLAAFAQGLRKLATQHHVSLIGGDTTQGPLSVSITLMGQVPQQQALLRSGARVGDHIYVSGHLGAAAASLQHKTQPAFQQAYRYPQAQIALGQALVGVAHACIDISDGLCADLSHVLSSSNVGVVLWADAIPTHPEVRATFSGDEALRLALCGGDDYQLVFTTDAPAETIQALSQRLGVTLSRIGEVVEAPGLRVLDPKGHDVAFDHLGFEHFKDKT